MESKGKIEEVFMEFGIDESYKAPAIIMDILLNRDKRELLFKKLLETHNYDVSYDWFYEYFQDEHAERKKKKQDFTPICVADLLSKLSMSSCGNAGHYYECCAGTGGIMIKHWDNFRKTLSPFTYKPHLHFAMVEELSDRTIPFLLINMMIRGMNGVVLHCDTIRRHCKAAYFICNTKDDHMQFSRLSIIPHTSTFERIFNVKFTSDEYIEYKELMALEDVYELLRGM